MPSLFIRTISLYFISLLSSASLSAATSSDFSVVDAHGTHIQLQQAAERIIALAPHIVENSYSAGAGSKLVAAVDYSDYPPAALTLPRVGNSSTLNLEAILALKPDLVLAWAGANKDAELGRLRKLGIPVYIDNPHNVEDIVKSVRDISILSGTTNIGEANIQKFQQQIAKLEQDYARQKKIRVFYQVWNQPLQSLNGSTLISSVLDLCGATNIFSEATAVAPLVSVEAVVNLNPELILSGGRSGDISSLAQWLPLTMIAAVKYRQLYVIDPDLTHRHSMRIAQGAQQACEYIERARAIKNTKY